MGAAIDYGILFANYYRTKRVTMSIKDSLKESYRCATHTISLMPCNLYGTNDNYEPNGSHVFPALIRRFVLAAKENKSEETLWGTGRPLREFLHVDDLANAVFHFMEHHDDPTFVNVGSGSEISIAELATLIAHEAGFHGKITWDPSKPDGMPRKRMDSSKANTLGWTPKISLEEGIRRTIREFRDSLFTTN